MNADRIAEIRAREQAATDGPWAWHVSDDRRWVDVTAPNYERVIATTHDDDLAEFIAHAREDVPLLLAEVERLRAERAESEARVREALVSLATVTDDEYATVVARHVESLLTLDLQTSGGEVQPEACPTVSGASPSEPDDPHGACSRNLVAVARERDASRTAHAALDAEVRALHAPRTQVMSGSSDPKHVPMTRQVCSFCGDNYGNAPYPCATVTALDRHAPTLTTTED